MSDKRFKWVLTALCLTAIIIAAMWKYPEAVKAYDARPEKMGEYLYIDSRGITHASRKCPRLNYKGMTSYRVRVDEYAPDDEWGFCPKCVSDKDYEKLTRNTATNI